MTQAVEKEKSLLGALDAMVDELRGNVSKAIAGEDADAVHDARVATRRLKAAMDLLEPLVSKRQVRPFAKITKKMRRRLGPLRDADVMLGHLAELHDARHATAVEWLGNRLRQARKQAVKQAGNDLPAPRVQSRLGSWWGLREEIAASEKAIDSLIGESVHLQLDAFVEGADHLVNRLKKTPAEGAEANAGDVNEKPSDTPNLSGDPHQLRIAGKSLRYTLEFAKANGKALPKPVMHLFKRLQDALGLWHDYVVLTDHILCESNQAQLALHQAELQESVLVLAINVLRKAEAHLRRVAQLWEQKGPPLVKEIREAFPLTQAVAAEMVAQVTPVAPPPAEEQEAEPQEAAPAA